MERLRYLLSYLSPRVYDMDSALKAARMGAVVSWVIGLWLGFRGISRTFTEVIGRDGSASSSIATLVGTVLGNGVTWALFGWLGYRVWKGGVLCAVVIFAVVLWAGYSVGYQGGTVSTPGYIMAYFAGNGIHGAIRYRQYAKGLRADEPHKAEKPQLES